MPAPASRPPDRPVPLWVGTSGYAYGEWIAGGFYPPGTASRQMLAFYARRFAATELNYTWYQMPTASALERMLQQVPAGFRFAAKLTRTLTHEVDPGGWRAQAQRYRSGIAPLVQEQRLLAVLVQLPPSFRRTPPHRRYLAELLDELADLPLAVEFRHASWASDRVFAELERRRTTLVAVDEPALPGLFPRLAVVTNPALFYVRFHGRNQRGWRSGDMQQQFDYTYSAAELQSWVAGPVSQMVPRSRRGVFFFNNHVRAQAPANARQLVHLLERQGLSCQPAAGP